MSIEGPPQKKRKLNDEECDYVPSENEDDISEYEPSDDQDDDISNLLNNTNSNTNSNNKEEKDAEIDSNNSNDENNSEQEQSEKDDSKPLLSAEDDKKVRSLFKTINTFTATQLKSFLRNLKSLRSIDGESVFEDISMAGKKEELKKRVNTNIIMIYYGEIIVPIKSRYSWFGNRNKVYKDTIDFDGWKLQIKQFVNLTASQSSKRSKSNNCGMMNGSLISRLNACDKNQIIAALELLFGKQKNGSELAKEFEGLLPKPNLETVFKRHNVLINAISKAKPWTKYGSSGDNFCFKRCRSSINTAKKAIINDGKNVMDSKEWDTVLEYLIVSSNNIDKFPVWDDDKNNCAVRDLKKKLKVWYGKVRKGLGKNVNDIQKKRLKQLDSFLKEK
eukprot:519825_1